MVSLLPFGPASKSTSPLSVHLYLLSSLSSASYYQAFCPTPVRVIDPTWTTSPTLHTTEVTPWATSEANPEQRNKIQSKSNRQYTRREKCEQVWKEARGVWWIGSRIAIPKSRRRSRYQLMLYEYISFSSRWRRATKTSILQPFYGLQRKVMYDRSFRSLNQVYLDLYIEMKWYQ